MDEKLKSIIEQLREFTTSELCDGAIDYHTMDYHIKRRVSDKKIVGPHLRSIRQKESVELFRMRFWL